MVAHVCTVAPRGATGGCQARTQDPTCSSATQGSEDSRMTWARPVPARPDAERAAGPCWRRQACLECGRTCVSGHLAGECSDPRERAACAIAHEYVRVPLRRRPMRRDPGRRGAIEGVREQEWQRLAGGDLPTDGGMASIATSSTKLTKNVVLVGYAVDDPTRQSPSKNLPLTRERNK